MKIAFLRKEGIKTPFMGGDRIEIFPGSDWDPGKYPWDDHGYETTFHAALFYKEKKYELPQIKILVENEKSTHKYFQKILQKKAESYIFFPLNDTKYISLSTDTEFYQTLYSLFNKEKIDEILNNLHDASYIRYSSQLNDNNFLMKEEGFHNSLLRDITSKESLDIGWLIIENRTVAKDVSFDLEFQLDNYANKHKIEINFQESDFPNDINVLIGSNGTGKSQALAHLIDELLGIGKTQQLKRIPVFGQIVVIAYSPFENFRTSLNDVDLKIKSVYKYFGFKDSNGNLDKYLPFKGSIESIFEMLEEDNKKDYLLGRPNKFDTFERVISRAIDFDFIAFELKNDKVDWQPQNNNEIIDGKYYVIKDKDNFIDEIDFYKNMIRKKTGIVFVKNGKALNLSSGQQIFAQLISSIIGSIREDTILLIDEPELYLHPNLEVELIELLKELLKLYRSYSIIATHSSIVAREVPKDYITVLKRKNKDEKIKISRPPFETFGGDIERINSYVFFDKDIEKPFEKWLQKLVNDAGGAKEAIKQYKNELNEESIILMYGMKVDNAD